MKTIFQTVILLASLRPALADSWPAPCAEEYYSSDSIYFVRVIPRFVPDKYYKWMAASPRKKKRFTARDTTLIPCHAFMYKRTSDGDSLIWEEQLINVVAPQYVIVADQGTYMITFDNWFSVGYGVDVMVVYDQKGRLLKRHMLEDISPFPINTYTLSISSLWWRCGQKILDDNTLEICFMNKDDEKLTRLYNLKELKIAEASN